MTVASKIGQCLRHSHPSVGRRPAGFTGGPQFLWFGIGKIRDLRLSKPCSFGYLSETCFTIHHIPAWIVFVRYSPNKTVAMKTVKHALLGLVLAMFISTYSNQRSPTSIRSSSNLVKSKPNITIIIYQNQ